jgi:hypothetical protein
MKKLSILFAAFAVMFLVSCGKYEDGPGFSLRSKAGRVAGSWTYDKAFINNVDVTSLFYSSDVISTLEFTKDGAYTETETYAGQTDTDGGKWEFTNSDENIKITYNDGYVNEYKILRLTNTEMWWSETDGTDTYEVHLKAK